MCEANRTYENAVDIQVAVFEGKLQEFYDRVRWNKEMTKAKFVGAARKVTDAWRQLTVDSNDAWIAAYFPNVNADIVRRSIGDHNAGSNVGIFEYSKKNELVDKYNKWQLYCDRRYENDKFYVPEKEREV